MKPPSAPILRACALIICLGASVSELFGYRFEGPRWPPGSQIAMSLELGSTNVQLQDGSGTWNNSAADALSLWNEHLDLVKFTWSTGPGPAYSGDKKSSVFFATTVFGEPFGQYVLAVTWYRFNEATNEMTETDTIFNKNVIYDSYRGPKQFAAFDFHRVALHEFGHTLGLGHSQSSDALMNAIIGDLDHLSTDDIAGARALYGMRITSPLTEINTGVGESVSYQITANNSPTSFGASGLPPGLQLHSTTGLITGKPTAGGTFTVILTARGPVKDVSATLRVIVAGPLITSSLNPPSVPVGNDFTYQLTATNNSTNYRATGLPPGLRLDATTGIISGVPTISGTYNVTVIAQATGGDAIATLKLVIATNPVPSRYDLPTVSLPIGGGPMVTDSMRSRIYVATEHSIAVVDTTSPRVEASIPISADHVAVNLSISPDGKVLWFCRANGTIGRIDLETLAALPDLPTNELVVQVREGLNHRLYGASANAGVLQLDAITGATQGHFDAAEPSPGYPNYCSIEISPDRRTLYVGQSPAFPGIHKYDVSTPTPKLLQKVRQDGGSGELSVSHNGARLCFWTSAGNGRANLTNIFATSNITLPLGLLDYQDRNGGSAVFSQDDSLIFQLAFDFVQGQHIAVFDSTTRQLVRAITLLPNDNGYGHLAVDANDSYIIVSSNYIGKPNMSFYPIHVPEPTFPPHSLVNVSTRLRVQTQDNVLIGGFILQGSATKKLVLRAIGPSMAVSGPLADPTLTLYNSAGKIVASNDNWNAHRQAVLNTGLPPADEHEAVIITSLPPGAYTMAVRGVANKTGVGLVELYDIDSTHARLANISTRGKVETGDNVMIGGFIIGSDQPTKVIVRAIGPSLSKSGVTGALQDPILELYNGNGSLMTRNDDWRTLQEAAINGTQLPPADNRESAIVATLQPGNYTAIVRGKNDSSGIAVVEVFNLEAN